MSSQCLFGFLNVKNSPATGTPQPLQNWPRAVQNPAREKSKRKQAFELSAKAETWPSGLLLNVNHKDLFSFPSIAIHLLFTLINILQFFMPRLKSDNAGHYGHQCVLPDTFRLAQH